LETDSIPPDFSPFVTFNAPGALEIAAIAFALLLLAVSALLSGAEVAYFSLKPTELDGFRKRKSKSSKWVIHHLDDPNRLLATILVVKTVLNALVVLIFVFSLTAIVNFGTAMVMQFIFDAIIVTLLLLVIGELVPRAVAVRHCNNYAAFMAMPIWIASVLTKPLTLVLVESTNVVTHRMSRNTKNLSVSQISHALDLNANELTEEKEMLEGIVKFSNINVGEIMTPRVDVIDIDIHSEFSKVLATVVESGYSRIPVYDETPDNVKGILYVKDLLPYLDHSVGFDWTNVIRQAYYVPITKKINDLLGEFKTKKLHMAIVVDEYGGTAGIVTLEDVLEEIVGEISDETDEEETKYTVHPDGSFVFEGKVLLNDFRKITNIDGNTFDEVAGDAETLAGLLLELKGVIPQKNETIEYGDYHFTVVSADNRRIKKVKFQLLRNVRK
jgi:putative hemolysin